MAKASDYRTVARGIAPLYVRARLLNDEPLGTHLYRALEHAISMARRLAELEAQGR